MRESEPTNKKLKRVWEYFPNIIILTKSITLGKVQLTFVHASVGNRSIGRSVTVCDLAGSLNSPYDVPINSNIAFSITGYKICLPIAEVLLHISVIDLARSKKQRDWAPLNVALLPPFLTEAELLDGDNSAEDILKIYARTITELAAEDDEDDEDEDDKGI